MGNSNLPPRSDSDKLTRALLDEVRAMRSEQRDELRALRRLFDQFAGVFFNAKFPFGKPMDRWGRR